MAERKEMRAIKRQVFHPLPLTTCVFLLVSLRAQRGNLNGCDRHVAYAPRDDTTGGHLAFIRDNK